ncbi:MAG: hypothetical protein OXI43_11250 [Candidatus Poribacteria bacterium]|nr:hypothetical protein [Candidatus Poribacteria bacterium]
MLKRLNIILILLFAFSFSGTLLADESANKYFPSTLGSFWVYEDQDGNELTRHAIEGEEIAGKTFPAFNYEPELEDWAEYSPFIRPSLYQVSDAGVTLFVREEVEKAVKARLTKEIETVITKSEEEDPSFKLDYDVEVEVPNIFYILPEIVTKQKEWEAVKINAKITTEFGEANFNIIESGKILGTQSVKTSVGTFKDCLKVEYRTETILQISPPDEDVGSPGESITTLWLAPNVGVVKVHQKVEDMLLKAMLDLKLPSAATVRTLELTKYEIKSADTKSSENNSISVVKSTEEKVETEKAKSLSNDTQRINYLPSPLGSFWVYEDQDGNELTRRAVEGEEIVGKAYQSFSYEPELKKWMDYSFFIRPSLYQVSDAGVTLFVREEVEKAAKARLSKEMELLRGIIELDDPDAANFTFIIEAEAQDQVHLLLTPVIPYEEWDVNQIKASLKLQFEGDQPSIDYTIIETGIVTGTEDVETAAGVFEDCLKVEYHTETTAIITPDPRPGEKKSPGETMTTVWYAPNVGIVKLHQKRKYAFFDMIPDDDSFQKPPDPKPITLELKKYEIKTVDLESARKQSITTPKPLKGDAEKGKTKTSNAQSPNYFPGTLDSFWVYEDQDGNELTRRAVEGEEIAGKTYPAFSYEPELEDWAEYSWFIRPPLYQVSNAGITLVVSDEVEKAVKARLKKEVGILTDAIKRDAPLDAGIDADIKVQGQNQLFLLPDTIILFNEEWDVNQIEANVKMKFLGGGVPEDQQLVIDFTILETAIISGTETVETPAGKFENCLKVEYRTETTAAMTPAPPPDEVEPPGETVTTVWYAPNVGIVQFRQETNYIFLEMIPDDEDLPVPPGPKTKTFELKKYEIKSEEPENEESN